MATKRESLVYDVNINDQAYYNELVASQYLSADGYRASASPDSIRIVIGIALGTRGKWDGSPLPLQVHPTDTFSSPSARSAWFTEHPAGDEPPFPRNKDEFTRRSGGWLGVPALFGDKTIYTWIAHFVYVAPIDVVPPTVTKLPLQPRRWIDGGELPQFGEGANAATAPVARRASRHTQGLGYVFDSTSATRVHDHNENGIAYAPGAWERFYIRVERFPDLPLKIWSERNSITAAGVLLTLTSGGTLTLNDFDGLVTATPIGAVETLVVHRWYRVDLIYSHNRAGANPIPSICTVYINGLQKIQATGSQVPGLIGTTKNVILSTMGGGKVDGTPGTGIWQCDDWVGVGDAFFHATMFQAQALIGAYADFIKGSRVALIGATGFAASHNAAWVGDWRLTRQRPVTTGVASQLTSAASGATLSVTTDADVEIDGQPNQLGIAALNVALYSDKGGGGANGTLGYAFNGGAPTVGPIVQNFGGYSWTNRLWPGPAALAPLTPVAGLELVHGKGASTDPAKVQALLACAEIIGVFADEDRYPNSALGNPIADPPVGTIPAHIGIHNAPYPHIPQATALVAPQSGVIIKAAQYTGNGTGQDLTFRMPIHFLWIRPMTGGAGGVQWWSSLNAAHLHGQRSYAPDTILEVLMDPLFVGGEGTNGETDMTLPPAPDNLEQAIGESNQLAYGFHKHDEADAVWAAYLDDPDYYWKRMLGWQAEGGPDQAPAGLYAVPPSPWFSTQQQQTLVRLAGGHLDSNAAGVVYSYVAFGDAGMRFSDAGALAAVQLANDHVNPLDVEQFLPETALVLMEQPGASAVQTLMLKGLGSGAAAISVLTLAEIASGLQFATGTLTSKAGLANPGGSQTAFLAFRRNDGSGDPGIPKVLWLGTYIGDGGGIRTINFAPSGVRPLFALVVGHNGTAFVRDPYHLTTSSTQFPTTANPATGITGGAIDAIQLGSALNQAGIVYDILVFPGSATAGNGGWSVPGEFIPVDPRAPSDGPWDPEPEPPDGGDGGDGGDGDGDGDTGGPFPPGPGGNDFGPQCVAASTRLINQALSRIGVSKQIGDISTENTIEAALARLHYSDDVEATLRDFAWPFATRYATLVVEAGPTPPASPDWLYAYRRPSDCVFERRLCVSRGGGVDPTPPPFQLGHSADVYGPVTDIAINFNTAANPTVFSTGPSHAFATGQRIVIREVLNAVPPVNGTWTATVIDDTHFSIPVAVTTAGSGGTVTKEPVLVTAGGGLIHTNQANAVLEYTARPGCAASRGDPLFKDALIWRHAASLAPGLSRMTDVTNACVAKYQTALALAFAVLRPGNPGRPAVAATIDAAAPAAAANLAIVNRGLLRIGAQTITNLTTDQSRGAVAARTIFEAELQSVLRDFAWPFATRYADPLVLVAGTPQAPANADWTYSYRLPLDCVMARRLVSPSKAGRAWDPNPPKFRTGTDAAGDVLYAHLEDAVLEYTARLDGAVLISDHVFQEALAWRLAAALAPSLAQADPEGIEQEGRGPHDPREPKVPTPTAAQLRQRIADGAWQQYNIALNVARASAMKEQQQFPDGPAPWITARGDGYPSRWPWRR